MFSGRTSDIEKEESMKKASIFLELARSSSDAAKDIANDIIFESLTTFWAYFKMCYKKPDYNKAVKRCYEVIQLGQQKSKEQYENRFMATYCSFYPQFSFLMDNELKPVISKLYANKLTRTQERVIKSTVLF